LVLDQGSGPSWKFNCNQCDFSMALFKGASKVSIETDKCSRCEWPLTKVVYSESRANQSNGAANLRGCVWCSSEFSSVSEAIKNYSNSFQQHHGNQGPHHTHYSRGGGRGGGYSRRRGGGRRGGRRGGGGGRGSRGFRP